MSKITPTTRLCFISFFYKDDKELQIYDLNNPKLNYITAKITKHHLKLSKYFHGKEKPMEYTYSLKNVDDLKMVTLT